MAGVTRKCLRHQDRPSVVNCAQCHDPLCKECVHQVFDGAKFCSQDCVQKYKEFKAKYKPQPTQGGLVSKLVTLVVLVGVVVGGLYAGRILGVGACDSILKMIGL